MKNFVFAALLLSFFLSLVSASPAKAAGDADIGTIYVTATSSSGSTSEVTVAEIYVPYFLYKFFYDLVMLCLAVILIYFVIKDL